LLEPVLAAGYGFKGEDGDGPDAALLYPEKRPV